MRWLLAVVIAAALCTRCEAEESPKLVELAQTFAWAKTSWPAERCHIDADLHVSGTDPEPCVAVLETAARLARAELRVNRAIKAKARR